MDKKKNFADVIFTDENTLGKRRHKGTNTQLKYVWAGVSKEGATPIVLFSDIYSECNQIW